MRGVKRIIIPLSIIRREKKKEETKSLTRDK